MNVIAVTAYQRPEFLHYFLKYLARCPELKDYILYFFLDKDADQANHEVIMQFETDHPEVRTEGMQRSRRMHPQLASYNILQSYQDAAKLTDDYLIICEEDTFVTPDFLRFNHFTYEYFLKKFPRIFCTSHKRRQLTEVPGSPNLLIGDPQCTSPTCVTKEAVETYMVPLFSREHFFTNPALFNSLHYPNSRIQPHTQHIDHDGAIERMMEVHALFAIKPDHARTMHAGFVGGHLKANRHLGTKLKGTLKKKIKTLGELLEGGAQSLRNMASHQVGQPDFDSWRGVTGIDLEAEPSWDQLELDLDRSRAKASEWYYDDANTFKAYIEAAS